MKMTNGKYNRSDCLFFSQEMNNALRLILILKRSIQQIIFIISFIFMQKYKIIVV